MDSIDLILDKKDAIMKEIDKLDVGSWIYFHKLKRMNPWKIYMIWIGKNILIWWN